MVKKTWIFARGNLIKVWLDRLGGLFITRTKAEKGNVFSVSELERLEIIRKLREERKSKKFSRTDIAIEDITFRKW